MGEGEGHLENRFPPIAIIGLGALGRSLALALHHRGFRHISGYSRDPSLIHPVPFSLIEGLPSPVRSEDVWVFLSLPDDQIPVVAERLARSLSSTMESGGTFAGVIHTSGAQPSELLDSLRNLGIPVASMHPLQTFPPSLRTSESGEAAAQRFVDLPVSVEGDELLTQRLMPLLRDVLGARPFPISRSQKAALHTAAVFASNALVPCLSAARTLLRDAGLDQGLALLEPLILQTLWNIDAQGERALSGPILRGDLLTVTSHLELLRESQHLLDRYRLAGKMIFELLPPEKTSQEPWVSIEALLEGKREDGEAGNE